MQGTRAVFAMPILYRKFFCHAKDKVYEGGKGLICQAPAGIAVTEGAL